MKNIILPKENEKDLADIPKPVLDVLNIYLAETMDEVLKTALAELNALASVTVIDIYRRVIKREAPERPALMVQRRKGRGR